MAAQADLNARIPIPQTTQIERYTGTTISSYLSLIQNGMIEAKPDGTPYIIQRPSFVVTYDASDHAVSTKGRGLFNDRVGNVLYYVNNDTIYYGVDYISSLTGTITGGIEQVTMLSLAGYLIILDSNNSQGWTQTGAGSVTQITDTDFPPKQGTPVNLVGGGAVLNGVLYVLGRNGSIYGSDSNDPTSWNALNVIQSQRETDYGMFLGKHFDHIVAFSQDTIEFFYDAGNATGSPLSRRNDISYNIGSYRFGADATLRWNESFSVSGDKIYFVGVDDGMVGVYVLENFQIRKISNPDLDDLLASLGAAYGITITATGCIGHEIVFVQPVAVGGVIPLHTFVYDNGHWYIWISPLTTASVVDAAPPSQALGEDFLMMSNGDVVILGGALQDNDGATSTYITTIAEHGQWDGGTFQNKTCHWLAALFDLRAASTYADLQIDVSDGVNNSFGGAYTLSASAYEKATSLGQFIKRNHRFTMVPNATGAFKLRYEGLEMNYDVDAT